jgi:hypothetical protein
MKLLKLLRPDILILLAFVQLIFRYGFLELQPGLLLALNDWQYLLLVLTTVLIAAGGALMEAISGPDKYNNGVTEAKGYNIYIAFNLAAIGIGYYISDFIGRPGFVAVFIVASALLFISATNLRSTLLAKNIIISLCAALSIIIIGIFEFFPFLSFENKEYFQTMFRLLLDYALFAFLITFLYTLVLDLLHSDKDYNSGRNTLAIALGKQRTARVAVAVAAVLSLLLLFYVQAYLVNLLWALIYVLLFILGPIIYFMIKIWPAKTQAEYRHLAIIVKLIMVFAAVSAVVITLNIHNYA